MRNTEGIINRLPLHLQAYREDSLLRSLIDGLASEIGIGEDNLAELMKARWFFQADLDALDKMGSLFGISRLSGERREPYRKRFYLTVQELLLGSGTVESISNIVEATMGSNPVIEENPPEFMETAERNMGVDETWYEFNKSIRAVRPTIIIKPGDNVRNPAITNLTEEETITYRGLLRKGALLKITPEGRALLGGIDVSSRLEYSVRNEKQDEPLPPKMSKMQSEWKYTDATAFFNFSNYSHTVFASREKKTVSVQLKWIRFKPATFNVRIPLYSGSGRGKSSIGYEEHLRQEVRTLVEHVKSAGVMAVVNFFDNFTEKNRARDLGLEPIIGVEYKRNAGQKAELEMNLELTLEERQKSSDSLITTGVFDFTPFNSQNLWA